MVRFPTDPSRRDAWVRAVRRENWTPSEHSRICKLHFISGKPSPFPNNPDYVPLKFSFTVSTSSSQRDKISIDMKDCNHAVGRDRQNRAYLGLKVLRKQKLIGMNQSMNCQRILTSLTLPHVTEQGELHCAEHLLEENQRVVTLEDELKAAKEVISSMEVKYKEAVISYTYSKKRNVS